jgi:hypothetical protein
MNSLSEKLIKLNRGKIKQVGNAIIVRYGNDLVDSEVIITNSKKDIFVNMETKTFGKRNSCNDVEVIERLQGHAGQRAKTHIKRLILCNNLYNHCGFTYANAEDGIDREKYFNDEHLFIKRLGYQQKRKINYVSVPEIQPKRYKKYGEKVLHPHIALDFYITEREFFAAWNNKKCLKCEKYSDKKKNFQCKDCQFFKGVVWVNRDKDFPLRKTANYIAKYVSKGFTDGELNQRSFSQNRYSCSHGLKMPGIENLNLSKKQILKIKKASNHVSTFSDGNSFNVINDSVLNDCIDSK